MTFGRLERSVGAAPMSDINVTPLVDVMLVLVVIFIMTAPLLASSIRLNLPKVDAPLPNATEGAGSSALALVIDKDGQVFLNDQPILPAQLAERFIHSAAQNPDTEVQLRADETVPYGKVVELMGLAQKAGLSRLGFVTHAPPAGPPNSPP